MEHVGTILIVDDDPVACYILKSLLVVEDYDLVLASNGPEALAKAKEIIPDLILLDVMMPGM